MKYYIYDEENKKVIKDNIPTLETALFLEKVLLKRVKGCVTWSIHEYIA